MTTHDHDPRLPLAAPRDVRALALWSLGYGLTAPLPPRAIGGVLGALTRLNRNRATRKAGRLAPRMAEVLAPYLPGADYAGWARVYYEAKLEERMGLWWSLHGRPWPLTIEVAGRHHLDAALGAGRGAILWGMEFGGVMTRKCARGGAHAVDFGLTPGLNYRLTHGWPRRGDQPIAIHHFKWDATLPGRVSEKLQAAGGDHDAAEGPAYIEEYRRLDRHLREHGRIRLA